MKEILTFDFVGSDDSMVLLLLESEVGEPVLEKEAGSLSIDVRRVDGSEVVELESAEPRDVETSEFEFIELETLSLEIESASLDIETATELDGVSVDEAVKLALASDVGD